MSFSSLRRLGIAIAALLLAACGRIDVAVTNTPDTRFEHVWVTVEQLWFHTDAAAEPESTGWYKTTLPSAITLDLATLSNGQVQAIDSLEKFPAGTYQQMRLVLKSTTAALASSASGQGLSYNNQVDYTDADGNEQHQPLDVLGAAQGIGIKINVVQLNNDSNAIVANFNTRGDIAELNYGDRPWFLLRPAATATDLAHAGAITGSVDTSLLETFVAGGAYDVVVSAESLSEDGTRHVIVHSTPLASDGSFVLAPLPVTSAAEKDNYAVVITGRNLQTVIVRDVPVKRAASPAALLDTATAIQSSAIPLTLGDEFAVNVDPVVPVSPRGAAVVFYQTLPLENSLPYAIVAANVDPSSGTLRENLALSTESIQTGAYNDGGNIDFSTLIPEEGAGTFQVFAEQQGFLRIAATRDISAANAVSGVSYFAIAALPVQSPALAASFGGFLTRQPGSVSDSGYLFVSANGNVVTTIALEGLLLSGSSSSRQFVIANLPGGASTSPFAPAAYELDARTWVSTNLDGGLHASTLSSSVSLRTGGPSNIQMPVN